MSHNENSPTPSEHGWNIVKWAWDNRDEIKKRLNELRLWLFPNKDDPKKRSGILILGAGGVGKTTLGRILSGDFDMLADPLTEYKESRNVEKLTLSGEGKEDVEIVVLPGQENRRSTWGELLKDISSGYYRGIVLVSAFGYHSLAQISYKQHRLYEPGAKPGKFLEAFSAERRSEELKVLRNILPHIKTTPTKLWMMSVITKQDLWWENKDVVKHYQHSEYQEKIEEIQAHCGLEKFRHEYIYCSLIINRLMTDKGELMKNNKAGYDHGLYMQSLRRLFETIDSMREWEEG